MEDLIHFKAKTGFTNVIFISCNFLLKLRIQSGYLYTNKLINFFSSKFKKLLLFSFSTNVHRIIVFYYVIAHIILIIAFIFAKSDTNLNKIF